MTDATTPTRRSANIVTALADEHPVATFFAATLAISWGVWTVGYALTAGGPLTEALILPGGFGPALGAALVTWLRGDSLRAWADSIVDWRVSPRWYLAAFGLPALAATGASGLYFLGGGPVAVDRLLRMVPLLPVLVLVTALVGGGNEEPGWRGFALPHLTERLSAFTASLVIGVVWAVWHFPLFLMGAPRLLSGSLLLYSMVVVAVSVLLTWVYESTGRSVLLALTPDDTTSARLALSALPVTATGIAACSTAVVSRLSEHSGAIRIVRAVSLAVVAFLTLTHVGLVFGNVL